jgi:hypothetical protein
MNSRLLLLLFVLEWGTILRGEIIDFRISIIDSSAIEERVLVEREYVDDYLSSLNAFVSSWEYVDSVKIKCLSSLPFEIKTTHHTSDSAFLWRRTASLEKMKRKYEFSITKRRNKNQRIEWIRNVISYGTIFLQTGIILYRVLFDQNAEKSLYELGVVSFMDICILLIHWQSTQMIYQE